MNFKNLDDSNPFEIKFISEIHLTSDPSRVTRQQHETDEYFTLTESFRSSFTDSDLSQNIGSLCRPREGFYVPFKRRPNFQVITLQPRVPLSRI
ncbi:hypothetical protein CDAR_234141 [Caerostris darwini]|uniref:Uncharacterized protein n=1 Tax=Caerostris darwini TaxID=1538125 RepID=A0AAV4QIC1_9ARAC|nr:hypothetical protein CDAR_234141 [Caerostris darwini]